MTGERTRRPGWRQRWRTATFVCSFICRVFPMPVATSKEESVSHSYTGLAPYLGVSPDRQLFVEFNVDEVRKYAPYMGSVCLFLKLID
ncbi:hypothetical protein OUZ56_012213 [Daphnia magna]|uniref:Uncharacterized protein n=1 Tax=Daphnia magna TaxID=35525 RepID=A0ABQ9Z2C4_9CRUS|nr:hypothetical protein OUZ56_012213 [Daphnia magna]